MFSFFLNILLSVKNLLKICEYEPTSTAAAVIAQLQRPSKQNSFIWYLLYQNFDAILLSLIHEHRWSKDVAEMIRLIFHNVDMAVLRKSLQDWMIANTMSSSEPTYPGSSEPGSGSRSNCSSTGSDTQLRDSKPSKKVKEPEQVKPRASDEGSLSPGPVANTLELKSNSTEKLNEALDNHLSQANSSISGKSNSSMSEHSATLGIEDEENDGLIAAGSGKKRQRESENDEGGENPSKRFVKICHSWPCMFFVC